MDVRVTEHFYTTDFFQASAYHERAQVLSIYYLVEPVSETDGLFHGRHIEKAEFVPRAALTEDYVTLPIDRLVLGLFLRLGTGK